MDTWSSPWADDTNQDDDLTHRATDPQLTAEAATRVDILPISPFTAKLGPVVFGGASPLPGSEVWASDLHSPAGIDNQPPWSNVPTTIPLSHSQSQHEDAPDWGENQADSLPQSSSNRTSGNELWMKQDGHVRPSKLSPEAALSVDWLQQPDWNATEAVSPPRTSSGLPNLLEGSNITHDVQCHTKSIVDVKDAKGNQVPFLNLKSEGNVAAELVEKDTADGTVSFAGEHQTSAIRDKQDTHIELENNAGDEDDFGNFGDSGEFGEFEDFAPEEAIGFESESAPVPVPVAGASEGLSEGPLSPLDFDTHSSLVLKLYPILQKPPPLDPVQNVFSTPSSRDTWYRITRAGTMGKHTSGDGDDYVRVTWSKSRIRSHVIEIVNRWIREGRFSVADSIGGDRGYGAMFGWGDGSTKTTNDRQSRNSVPVGLSLRGYREGPKIAHKASVSISSWDPLASGKTKDATPVADFGWGSSDSSKGLIATTVLETALANTQQGAGSRCFPPSSMTSSLETLGPLNDSTPTVKNTSSSKGIDIVGTSTAQSPENQTTVPQHIASGSDTLADEFKDSPFGSFTVPGTAQPEKSNQSILPKSTDAGNWGSLDVFEKANVQAADNQPAKTSSDMDLRSFGSKPEERPNERQMPNPLQISATVDDEDDWGEMINSPSTSTQSPTLIVASAVTTTTAAAKTRRPSTANGNSRPFGVFDIGALETMSSTVVRRDSAPSLTTADNKVPDMIGGVMGPTRAPIISSSADTFDWDFSVFERPAVSKAPPHSTAKEQVATKEDKLVMDIIDGLPDLGYMLM